MNRTKWMRLAVRDLGDVIRWAGAQNAREIGEFRYRVVNGREMVSFRLVPRYAIDIGAREIIVLAYARVIGWRARMREFRRIAGARTEWACRTLGIAPVMLSAAASLPPHRIARLRPLSAASRRSPSQSSLPLLDPAGSSAFSSIPRVWAGLPEFLWIAPAAIQSLFET